jgi:putative SbcD/Mre11-related phosphoesterase
VTAGYELSDRACYLPAVDALVVADVHLGLDETSAVTMPLGERAAVLDHLEALLGRFDPERLVIAGDVLHAFDTIPRGVEESLSDLGDLVSAAGARLQAVRGNHDTMLEELPFPGEISQAVTLGDTVVCHGHERPDARGRRYVVGHEHPTIEIAGSRHPCTLVGPGRQPGSQVIVLPALTPLARGTPVNELRTGDALSPFLAEPGAFRPVVVGEETVHRFPPLSDLRPHL